MPKTGMYYVIIMVEIGGYFNQKMIKFVLYALLGLFVKLLLTPFAIIAYIIYDLQTKTKLRRF